MFLSVHLIDDFSLQFGELLQPYMKYCLNEAQCLQYLKNNRNENDKFRTYLAVSTILQIIFCAI